jgi:hypothetical protein
MGQAVLDQMPQPARADDRMWMSEETKCAERNLLDSGVPIAVMQIAPQDSIRLRS